MRLSEWKEIEIVDGGFRQYRVRAICLLRKYLKMSIEIGRLPSLVGREFFRARVTSYSTHTFEDAVIFVHDMERSLELLNPSSQLIIARIFFQDYTYTEAARMLGMPRRTFVNRLGKAVDRLTGILLDRGLMERPQLPLSAGQANDPNRRLSPADEVVRVSYLMTLRYPKFCQQKKFSKAGLTA